MLVACLSVLVAMLVAPAPPAGAAAPPGFREVQLSSTIRLGTGMAFAPDGRLFVLGQNGVVSIVKDGQVLPTPFLDLRPNVDWSGERGLTGIAFDPHFAFNGYVYLYYTVIDSATSSHNRISRFTAQGDVALAGETRIADLEPLTENLHNGGAMAFGPDGKLYVTVGDNGVSTRAQQLTNRFGKVLRLNSDGSPPADNPFFATTQGGNRAIWAIGLRNPFSLSFSRAGVMHINDVGEKAWEEINVGRAGANYGWPLSEGTTTTAGHTSPLYAYPNTSASGGDCAITGGGFYEPATPTYPSDYAGDYFFADFCSDWIKRRDASGTVTDFITASSPSPVDVEVGPDGDLYYLTRRSDLTSSLFRVDFDAGQSATITAQPTSQRVSVGEPADFTVSAVGAAPLSYQWQRNGTNITGATSATYRLASTTTADSGARFRVVVRNSISTVTSAEATLTVTTDRRPTATIASPASGATYAGGDVISFSGAGTDPEDGTLPGTALTWRVDFHHAEHSHPFEPPRTGASGSFTIPSSGHLDSNVWYRVHLSAVDSAGLVAQTFRDISPRRAALTVTTVPVGVPLTVDGQPRTAPYSEPGAVVGLRRTLSVPPTHTTGGREYVFVGWSDGGAATHTITTPAAATTYTATYRLRSVTADADTVVRQQAPTTPGGSTTTLLSDTLETTAGTRATSYLRFTVPTLAAGESISAAQLSLQVTNGTTNGPAVWRTGTTWTESTMTWNSGQPARSGTAAIGNFAAMATGRVSTPLSGITGAGQVSLQLYAEADDGVQFTSREGAVASRPQLVLTMRSTPTAPTSVAVTKNDTARSATITWAPPASDGGSAVTGYRVSRDGFDSGGTGAFSTVVPATTRTFTMTSLLPGATYRLSVQAVNAAGTGPAASSQVTLAGRQLVLDPAADTMAEQLTPTTPSGSATTLFSDTQETTGNAATRQTAYVRFTIPTLTAGESISAARLSLQVTNATTNGPALWRTATTWNESTLSWNSGRPARSGTAAVGNYAAMAVGRVDARVSGVTAAGDVSFELYADVDDGVQFASRESTTVTNRPRLVVNIAPPA